MELLGMALMAIGCIAMIVGGLWFIVKTFEESVLWGLGCLFVPFVSLFFLFLHWDKAGKPFLLQIAGLIPAVIGAILYDPNILK